MLSFLALEISLYLIEALNRENVSFRYRDRKRFARCHMVGSFTKISNSSKIIRIVLDGKAIKIPLKWGVNQLSRVRNKEVTAI